MFGSIPTLTGMILGVACATRCAAQRQLSLRKLAIEYALTLPQAAQLIDPNLRFANMTLELPPQDFPILQQSFDHPPDCGETSYRGSGRLKGMRALVTGGDSGMGRAITIAYLREGAKVAINYLPEEEEDAQALSDFLAEEGLSIERIPGDLTNETFCSELVTEAYTRLEGLDVLVNHAGSVAGLLLHLTYVN